MKTKKLNFKTEHFQSFVQMLIVSSRLKIISRVVKQLGLTLFDGLFRGVRLQVDLRTVGHCAFIDSKIVKRSKCYKEISITWIFVRPCGKWMNIIFETDRSCPHRSCRDTRGTRCTELTVGHILRSCTWTRSICMVWMNRLCDTKQIALSKNVKCEYGLSFLIRTK
jgi:hypothetical protein